VLIWEGDVLLLVWPKKRKRGNTWGEMILGEEGKAETRGSTLLWGLGGVTEHWAGTRQKPKHSGWFGAKGEMTKVKKDLNGG